MKFDNVDVDGSGAIDADEFFEAIGEVRSPFTDKLFALIGKSVGCGVGEKVSPLCDLFIFITMASHLPSE